MPVTTSIREQIITRVKSNLANITTANGYANALTSAKVFAKFVERNDLPYACFWLTDEDFISPNSSYRQNQMALTMILIVNFSISSDAADAGLLTDAAESWLRDLKKWVYSDSSIAANKGLILDTIDGVLFWYVQSSAPYFDWQKNRGDIQLSIKINYMDKFT